ncbi:MAG: twin-arginine translocase TatA/TatE family subunit [bacterium]
MPCPAFLFGTGLDEWALLGVIAFLLFGPKRLPEIARTIGRTLEKLRRAADDFREQVSHLDDPPEPGTRRPEAGVGRPETGVGSPESGTRRTETGVRSPETGDQNPESGNRSPEPGG